MISRTQATRQPQGERQPGLARNARVAAGPEGDTDGPVLHQFGQVSVTPAPSGVIQRQAAPPKLKCGDITLDAQAQADLKTNKPFFSGADNNFVSVDASGKLCMDENNKVPEDPFRWGHLKDIVSNGHAEIHSVSGTTNFPIRDLTPVVKTQNIQLDKFALEGLTLMRPDVPKKVYGQKAGLTGLSTSDTQDQLYYSKLDSLAHEFFGHLWLGTQGLPYLHPPTVEDKRDEALEKGKAPPTADAEKKTQERLNTYGTLTAANKVVDPFGRPFTGTVGDYIRQLAGNKPNASQQSSTQGIGPSQAVIAINDLRFAFTLFKTVTPGQPLPPEVQAAWNRTNDNYEFLLSSHKSQTTQAPTLVTPDWIKKVVVELVEDEMTDPQKAEFRTFLNGSSSRLAKDVLQALPPAGSGTPGP